MAKAIEQMTDSEIEAHLKARKEKAKAKIAKEGAKVRAEVDAYVQGKYGLTLAQIFTASGKEPKQYKCPDTGAIWNGRGKRPAGLRNIKDISEYLVKGNGHDIEAVAAGPLSIA